MATSTADPVLTRYLALNEDLAALSAETGQSIPTLLDWLHTPEIARTVARFRAHQAHQLTTFALNALAAIISSTPDLTEQRRAATTILKTLTGPAAPRPRTRPSDPGPHTTDFDTSVGADAGVDAFALAVADSIAAAAITRATSAARPPHNLVAPAPPRGTRHSARATPHNNALDFKNSPTDAEAGTDAFALAVADAIAATPIPPATAATRPPQHQRHQHAQGGPRHPATASNHRATSAHNPLAPAPPLGIPHNTPHSALSTQHSARSTPQTTGPPS